MFGLAVSFCGFISHLVTKHLVAFPSLIAHETINIRETFLSVHGFMGMTEFNFFPGHSTHYLQ